jgi:hypothetical protein
LRNGSLLASIHPATRSRAVGASTLTSISEKTGP